MAQNISRKKKSLSFDDVELPDTLALKIARDLYA